MMTEEQERAVARMVTFLDRSGAPWWLDGITLREYALGRSIFELARRDQPYTAGMPASAGERLLGRARDNGFRVQHDGHTLHLCADDIRVDVRLWQTAGSKLAWRKHQIPERTIRALGEDFRNHRGARTSTLTDSGVWRYQLDPLHPYSICIPFGPGAYLDALSPGWYLTKQRPPAPNYGHGVFFDTKRKQFADRLLAAMYRVAQQAGCADAMWLAFGGLLGLVRYWDWIPFDNDIDMCIDTDICGEDACKRYLELLGEPGLFAPDPKDPDHWRSMFEGRRKGPQTRRDNGVPLWCSLGPLKPDSEHGVKSCQWFTFTYNGYIWHGKGRGWVTPRKFNQERFEYDRTDEGIMKGLPVDAYGGLQKIEYHGVQIRIPKNTGACCDFWYPGWPTPTPRAGGASAKKVVLVIGKWSNRRTWRIV